MEKGPNCIADEVDVEAANNKVIDPLVFAGVL
jgi:hypothetical protein